MQKYAEYAISVNKTVQLREVSCATKLLYNHATGCHIWPYDSKWVGCQQAHISILTKAREIHSTQYHDQNSKLHHLGDPVSRIFIHLENFRPRVSSSNVKSFQYGFELFIRDMRNPTAWKWLNEMSNFWSGNAYYFDLISKQCRLSTKICTWFQLATGCKKIPNIPWLLPSKRINLVRTKLGSIHWVYIVLWLTWEFEGDQGQQP